jgi:hypothetical protein
MKLKNDTKSTIHKIFGGLVEFFLAQNKVQCQAVVNAVNEPLVPAGVGGFLIRNED